MWLNKKWIFVWFSQWYKTWLLRLLVVLKLEKFCLTQRRSFQYMSKVDDWMHWINQRLCNSVWFRNLHTEPLSWPFVMLFPNYRRTRNFSVYYAVLHRSPGGKASGDVRLSLNSFKSKNKGNWFVVGVEFVGTKKFYFMSERWNDKPIIRIRVLVLVWLYEPTL